MNTNGDVLQLRNQDSQNYGTYETIERKGKPKVQTNSFSNEDQQRSENYDPYEYRNRENATSFGGTVFQVCIMSAGSSVLCIPQTCLSIGLAIGFFGTIFLVLFYGYNIHVFVTSEYELCKIRRIPHMSYFETVSCAFEEGPKYAKLLAPITRPALYLIFTILWLGYSACLLSLIVETMKNLYDTHYNSDIDVHVPLFVVIIPLTFFCWIRGSAFLVLLSFLGTCLNALCIFAVISYLITDPAPPTKIVFFGSFADLPLFVGSILFNVTATGVIMPLKNKMSQQRKFDAKFGVLSLVYPPTAVLFALFGLFCCLTFGENVGDNVINNLPPHQLRTTISKIMFIFATSFQFPLVVYVVFDLFWNNILKEARNHCKWPIFWEYIVRTICVAAVWGATMIMPSTDLFLTFCGAVLTPIDSIIVPSVVEILVTWKTKGKCSHFKGLLLKNFVSCCFAMILVVCGTVVVASLLLKYYS